MADLRQEDMLTVGADLATVQRGWPLGMPVVRKLEPGLWELRTRLTHGIARVLFTVDNGTLVLLHAFTKKSQRIPMRELQTARRRREDYRNA
ncbi:MAG: type II toxin-antitoxin system RelE/ParE family toxin [Coriobacteriia bacterium]|nr:type II toxin-antitoxin system RelE/ParE family toxin [Coriobacteriia bacterium]